MDGRTVKEKYFIRGTTLTKLSKKDAERLKDEYKLSTVIDLRCFKEMREKPNVKIDGVTYYEMPLSTETVLGISHEKKVETLKTLELMPPMEDLYVKLVTEECQENLIKIMKTILTLPDDQYAVFFHCSAGKDRTGIVAALILSFLGVDRQTIIQDYLFTNKFTRVKAFFVYFGLFILKWSHSFSKKIKQSLQAKTEFIESSLNLIESDFGSIDNFFTEKLHFTEEDKVKIRNRFLV